MRGECSRRPWTSGLDTDSQSQFSVEAFILPGHPPLSPCRHSAFFGAKLPCFQTWDISVEFHSAEEIISDPVFSRARWKPGHLRPQEMSLITRRPGPQ